MRQGFRYQQTNRPEVDAGTNPAGAAENRRGAITRKATAWQTEAHFGYHKRIILSAKRNGANI